MDDPRGTFRSAIRTATEAIDGVQPEQLRLPTPCDDMDVEAMVLHLAGVVDRVAVIGRGGSPFAVERRPSIDGAWADAVATYESVWSDDAALSVTSPLPWAPGSGADVLRMYTFELTAHTWDLATATGQAPAWDPEVSRVAADYAESMGTTPEARAERFEPIYAQLPPSFREMPPPFADPQPVEEDAPLIDKVVAWSGRRLPSTV